MKKSHQNQEAELQYEISRLKDQLQRTKDDFAKAQDKKNQVCYTSSLTLFESSLIFCQ